MAIGLLFGACTISTAPLPTPTPTQTEVPPINATTVPITATTAPAADIGLTTTAGITPTGNVSVPLPLAGTAVTNTTTLTTPAAATTPMAPLAAPITTTTNLTGTGALTGATGAGTIFQVISSTANLQTLASVLTAAGMSDALDLPGPFTLFAPTDEAFANLPAEQEEALLNNPAALAGVLQYHVVIDQVTSAQLAQLGAALSSSGQTIIITPQADGSLLVNNARLVQPDVIATNGVIHLIDQVLIPPAQ
jgi:uncharacterized surface protein with fasciclin (FAS1) repeats